MPRVVHFEIQGSDPEALGKFYSQLFAWKINRWGDAPYWLIETGARDQPGIDGGLLKRNGPRPDEGQSVNAFVCTVEVSTVDEYVARAQSLGASVAVPKMPIPGVGWLAYIKDPDGNILGLTQSDPTAK
jgi:predicted enzyme related to lactoylglutathione lyase